MISKVSNNARRFSGDFWSSENFEPISWERLNAMANGTSVLQVGRLAGDLAASIGLFSGDVPSTFVWDFSILPFEIEDGKVKLPWLSKARPHTLTGGGVSIHPGAGFRLTPGQIEFPIHPQELFGQETCVVQSLSKPPNSFTILSNYAPNSAAGAWMKAARESISPADLRSAAAWSAGLAVTPRDAKLINSTPIPSGRLYVFDSFNLEVPYPHSTLQPGEYPEGYVVCDDLEVRHVSRNDYQWWRDYAELRDSIPMAVLSPWNLTVPAQLDLVAEASSVPGKFHCKPQVVGTSGEKAAYWEAVKQGEISSNIWLADIHGLGGSNLTKTISGFDFLFGPESILKDRVTVVVTGSGVPGFARKRLYDFFHEERLLGTILIFIDRPENIIGTIVLGSNYWSLELGQDPDTVRQNA